MQIKKNENLLNVYLQSSFLSTNVDAIWIKSVLSSWLLYVVKTMTEPALFHCWSQVGLISFTLRKKCFYSKLFWSAFFRIWTEHTEIRIISPYSIRMWENAEQNNSVYGHFQYNFKRLNYLSDVEFVTCIAKINCSGLITSAKWLLTIRS